MKTTIQAPRLAPWLMRGFTIVELMVAMVISLFLLGGVVAIFASSKNTYERVERISRVQENGRFALNAIVRDIRAAGWAGCSRNVNFASTLRNATQLAWNFNDAIRGYDYQGTTTWSPALDSALTSPATGTNGSDAIVLRVPAPSISSGPVQITTMMTSQTADIYVPAVASTHPGLVSTGQIMMVADCHFRSVFEITGYNKTTGAIEHAVSAATTSTPGNQSADIGHAFEANSQLVPMHTVGYYIANSSGRIGLWRRIGVGAPEELVEGVERMELRFGEDTNGDRIANEYRKANAVANWNNVISVSVALLVRSPTEYGTEPDTKTYTLLDTTFVGPGDRYVRQIFTTTATLRNRAL